MSTRATWAVKAVEVGLLIVVTALFWWPAVRHSMWDYAIQQNPVMATHSAVVTDVWQGRAGHANVTYTTNTGERVDADLGPGMFTCCSVHKGEVIKVKYVSYDFSQVYESDYHPGYLSGIFYGGHPWSLRSSGHSPSGKSGGPGTRTGRRVPDACH